MPPLQDQGGPGVLGGVSGGPGGSPGPWKPFTCDHGAPSTLVPSTPGREQTD